jgi:hypothetical protein
LTTNELVAATILKATGELSTAVYGDDDYSKVLQLSNINIDKWAKETDWNSLYDPSVDCGTISATDTFDLDSSIRVVSAEPGDYIQIVRTDGNTTNYQTVAANELKTYSSGNYCARIGSTLVFNNAFTATSPEFGGTLNVPAYLYADHLVRATDTVPVDDPNWLVAITAADWTQTDLTLAQNRNDFLAEANDLMTSMKRHNNAQVNTIGMPQIVNNRSW